MIIHKFWEITCENCGFCVHKIDCTRKEALKSGYVIGRHYFCDLKCFVQWQAKGKNENHKI